MHKNYGKFPKELKYFLSCPELQRLKYIGQNCGLDYTSFFKDNFSYNYSRYHHSVGVAKLLWRYTKNYAITLSGLFHDISTPSFSHVVDFYNGDFVQQTSTEKNNKDIIINSKSINSKIKLIDLKIEDIYDYSQYSIADNPTPMLSADRLEYNLYMATAIGSLTYSDVKITLNSLNIETNEIGLPELCFNNYEIAKFFTIASINNGKCMNSNVSKFLKKYLSDILTFAIKNDILSKKDLISRSEESIIEIMKKSTNSQLKSMLQTFFNIDKSNTLHPKIDDKKRYVDPLVKINNEIIRISKYSGQIHELIEEYTGK